ncbi:MAG: hypothetical protein Kow0098_04420 [Ignavibacteriaceae bacterium]
MKTHFIALMLSGILILSCSEDNPVSQITDSKITAKEKISEVMNEARSGFASDASLAAIYGREVDEYGEIDLLNTSSFNAFVYVVQSDSLAVNEFYVPVFGAGAVMSPVNFQTMLSFVKDTSAAAILNSAFSLLSDVSINESAVYSDSPEVISLMNGRTDVSQFKSVNPDFKTDIFLLPSKSIDTTGVENSADWIVNFYSDTGSLVLWFNSGTGAVTVISE